jgi:phospholipid/cholesterol/gamma-HCH transport system substrate-binding protein
MAKRTLNHVKLGVFVIAGLAFLVLLLYVIGKNQNMFGNTFMLRARFGNVHGLMKGNNIRYAGINAGTVSDVEVLNDTTIEVTMLVKTKMKEYIRKNAKVSITTDGLMGNKLINIEPGKTNSPLAREGEIFYGNPGPDTDEMLRVLNATNNDIAEISKELKTTVLRINNSKMIWALLSDGSIPANIRGTLTRINTASGNMNDMMVDLNSITDDIKNGKGSVGQLLRDTSIAADVKETIAKIKNVGAGADSLSQKINQLVTSVSHEINNGKGTVNALLKDEQMRSDLAGTLSEIEKDSKTLTQVMEAIRHSVLFRGYFRRAENRKKHLP